MRHALTAISAGLAAVLPAFSVTLDVARLPVPSFADREVSGDVALPADRTAGLRTFRLELTFDATPSNNVQVAFGRDILPADGDLAAEETDFIKGVCQPPVFKDGAAAFAFPGLALTPFPDWLRPDLWTHLRVTVRGVSAANETVSARFLPDGARIIIR